MRHTAGMAYGFSGTTALNKLWPNTPADFAREHDGAGFLALLQGLPLLHHPASVWEYSVSNDVLGLLVEAVAQQSLGQFLAARLFAPAGHGGQRLRGADPIRSNATRARCPRIPRPAARNRSWTRPGRCASNAAARVPCPPRRTICVSRRCCSTAAAWATCACSAANRSS